MIGCDRSGPPALAGLADVEGAEPPEQAATANAAAAKHATRRLVVMRLILTDVIVDSAW
jgi:hypothetical protein